MSLLAIRQTTISRISVILALAVAALSTACGRPAKPQSSYFVYVSNEASGDLTVIDPDQPEAGGDNSIG